MTAFINVLRSTDHHVAVRDKEVNQEQSHADRILATAPQQEPEEETFQS